MGGLVSQAHALSPPRKTPAPIIGVNNDEGIVIQPAGLTTSVPAPALSIAAPSFAGPSITGESNPRLAISEPAAPMTQDIVAGRGDTLMKLLVKNAVEPDQAHAVIAALRHEHPDCDIVILDDGLQHYRLRRDLEIAVVDARGFGNGMMLPAGPLREPRTRLWTVDAVIAHGTDRVKGYAMRLQGEELHRATDARERRAVQSFAGERVHAVAGIGDPKRFFLHLAQLGVKAVPHPFPDHHPFRAADLEFGDAAPVLMTEKDAVKCKRFAKPQHWVLPVRAVPDSAFDDWLLRRLGELGHRPKAA